VLFEQLKAQGLTAADSTLTNFASPRRLAAHITAVSAQAADKAVSQKLMPVSVGLDASGNATPALLKKLQALGADASAVAGLKRAMDGKVEALFYDSTVKGATLAEGLQKALLESIAKLPIPKVMSYQLESGCELPGWSSVSFVRPAHGLVALHGSTVVPVQALGLKAGNTTQGHRFLSQGVIELADADTYALRLREDGRVIASFSERRHVIVEQLERLRVSDESDEVVCPDALLDEVTALVEWPATYVCHFEREFLSVPAECLVLTMQTNQKYFPCRISGQLTNRFLVVSNIETTDPSAIIGGNERVVRPRLADAKFFFDQDRKKTLASRVVGLGKVVYHNKLGTQGERVERVRAIARVIGAQLGGDALSAMADRAAMLAKADLLTDMVGEFPELQGTMGWYYARHDGEADEVAMAIEDHYKPRFAGDALPRNDVGVVVALADKLETLIGMFGIGNLPTGDKDPFALRRHALGVVRMLIDRNLQLQIFPLLNTAIEAFPSGALSETREKIRDEVGGFFIERIKVYFRDLGYSTLEVDAALYAGDFGVWADIPKRLSAVRAFAALPEAPALAAANKRVGNILKKAEGTVEPRINEALLVEPAEKALADALKLIAPKADAAWAAGQYAENLQALAALKGPVDDFFDKVMVNAEDPALKANRLGLLATLHAAMNRVADLSRLAA
jgi:glycyl-tRNA synthetase beta chain